MKLEPQDQRHLTAAEGYLEMGMFLAADAALDEIAPEFRHFPQVLNIREKIYEGMERWDMAVEIAKALMAAEPDSPRRATCLARVTRRAQSLEAAIAVLQAAIERRVWNNQLYYDLACYTCLNGRMDQAAAYLEEALKLDPTLRFIALEDKDLDKLWASLGNQ
jgi:tetratricopeptide (TPR) repeat protein